MYETYFCVFYNAILAKIGLWFGTVSRNRAWKSPKIAIFSMGQKIWLRKCLGYLKIIKLCPNSQNSIFEIFLSVGYGFNLRTEFTYVSFRTYGISKIQKTYIWKSKNPYFRGKIHKKQDDSIREIRITKNKQRKFSPAARWTVRKYTFRSFSWDFAKKDT